MGKMTPHEAALVLQHAADLTLTERNIETPISEAIAATVGREHGHFQQIVEHALSVDVEICGLDVDKAFRMLEAAARLQESRS